MASWVCGDAGSELQPSAVLGSQRGLGVLWEQQEML